MTLFKTDTHAIVPCYDDDTGQITLEIWEYTTKKYKLPDRKVSEIPLSIHDAKSLASFLTWRAGMSQVHHERKLSEMKK